ncbi:MAG TPA: hypothetical protein VEC12_13850 [Bacteroidia bacterium]|nr:hypothetical protein [Bacteroidia bacterium]
MLNYYNKFFWLFVLLIAVSCSNQQSVEERLYDCLKESYSKRGVDLEEAVDKAQQHLIKQGALQDTSARSLKIAIEKIELMGDADYYVDSDSVELIIRYFMDSAYQACKMSTLDRFAKDTSEKLNKIQTEFNQINNPTPSTIASIYLKYLTESDFGLPYYKATFISKLCAIGYTEPGLPGLLPPLPESETADTTLVVTIKPGNSIFIGNKEIKLSFVDDTVKRFISEYPLNSVISIKTSAGVYYDIYAKVKDLINWAYDDTRNEYSLKIYNQPFTSLSKELKAEAVSRFPKKIKERVE